MAISNVSVNGERNTDLDNVNVLDSIFKTVDTFKADLSKCAITPKFERNKEIIVGIN